MDEPEAEPEAEASPEAEARRTLDTETMVCAS